MTYPVLLADFSSDSSKENHEIHCGRRSTAQIRIWYPEYEWHYREGNPLVNKSGNICGYGSYVFLHRRSTWILHATLVLILLRIQ